MEILGIDIGGSAVKGAPVDTEIGKLTRERFRIEMPPRSTPKAVGECVAAVAAEFEWRGPIGVTFPGVVKEGVVLTAANLDKGWVGFRAAKLFRKQTGCPVLVLNDADAAGIAEMEFGAGRGHLNTVILLTLGTGVGSAIFTRGILLPNTELGHLIIRGKDAELRDSARARQQKGLSWKQWAARLNEHLAYLDFLFSPNLYIIGGGVSKRYDKFLPLLKSKGKIVPAKLFNDAGIVGAALAARVLLEE